MIHDEDRINEILMELQERLDRGEELDLETVLEEHSGLADKLRPHLKGLFFLDQALVEPDGLPDGMPESVGEYRIIRELGRGGMGIVYEAEQTSMKRRVALKLLAPVFTGAGQSVKRFQREARAAGLLQHTNIVPVYTMGKHESYWYYTMELVTGGSLHQMIEERRLGKKEESSRRSHYRRVAEMFAGVADGIDATHKAGVIHRDIKPSNLLLNEEGRLKIVDFGMARLDEAPSLTLSGEVLGTPVYMSPEQARAKASDIDHRTDIYSLGATIYEALTFSPPFKGKSTLAIRSQIITRDPPPPRQVDRLIPRDLAVICTKAMEKDRKDRYQTAGEMARDLTRFTEGVPILSRPIGIIGRSIRKIKRHKVRSALLAAAILMAIAAVAFAIRTSYVTEQNRILEYNQYLAWGQQEFPYSFAGTSSSMIEPHVLPGNTAHDFFGKAIACLPDKPDAYWLRAISPGRTMKERMDDLDRAKDRGLPERTVKLLRAYIESLGTGQLLTPESKKIYDDASQVDDESATDFFAKAVILKILGSLEESLSLLDRAIETTGPSSTIHFLASRHRARLHLELGDTESALQDFVSIMDHGESSPETLLWIAICWNRMNRKDKGQAFFEDAMQKLRALSSSKRWANACKICLRNDEPAWLDLISRETIKQFPDDPEILWSRARACINNEELDEALSLTDRILAKRPDSHPAYVTRHDIFLLKGEYDKALTAVDKAIEKAPYCQCGHMHKGALLWNHFEHLREDALLLFEKAAEFSPAYADALFNVGVSIVDLGHTERYDHALACLDRAGKHYAPDAFDDRSVIAYYRARILQYRGDFDGALKAYTDSIDYNGQNADAFNRRGLLYCAKLERYNDAISDFEKAVEYAENPSGPLANKGSVYHKMGRYDQALAAFNEALELNPDYIFALLKRANLYYTKFENPVKALQDNKHIIEIDSSQEVAHHQCGQIYYDHYGNYEEALVYFRNTVELNSERAIPHLNVANCLFFLERYDEAYEAFEKVVQFDSENRYAYVKIGEYLGERRRFDEAIQAFEKARKIDPDHAHSYIWLGYLYEQKGNINAVIETYRKWIATQPDNTESHVRLVKAVLYNLHRPEEALAVVTRALEIDSGNTEFISLRGLVLAIMGRFTEAREDVDKIRGCESPPKAALYNCREALVWCLCDYEEALKTAEAHYRAKAVPSRYDEIELAFYRVYCLRGCDRKDEAIDHAKMFVSDPGLDPNNTPRHFMAYLFAVAGDREQAETILEDMEEPEDESGLDMSSRVHAVLGNDERAMELLDRAAELGLPLYPPQPNMGPDFEHLIDDPRYQTILAKIHGE